MMSFHAIGSAENGEYGGVYSATTANDTIISSPALAGTYSYQVDPVNGNGFDQYGWTTNLEDTPNFLIVMFLFRQESTFSGGTTICELGERSLSGAFARRLTSSGTNLRFQIFDKDDDVVAQTADNYYANDVTYPMLWYVDQRTPTRDILWVYKSGAWDKALDITNHGDATDVIQAVTFGTRVSKAKPASGGPFYVDDMCVQVLNTSPNTTPIGSVTTRFKVPTANGTFSQFDGGTGTNPNWQDVDEIPPDEATTYDEGNVVDDDQSYAIANATGGDTPLAIQVIGVMTSSAGLTIIQVFIYDGTTQDLTFKTTALSTVWQNLYEAYEGYTYNDINGATITETLFNTLEAGVRITSLGSGEVVRLSQIGLEYIVTGPYALPDGFPLAPRKIVQVNQAVNRANTY